MREDDRWQRVVAVFHEAHDTPVELREQLLSERCAGDPDLRAEVLGLLEIHDQASEPEEAEDDPTRIALSPDAAHLVPGRRLGPYTILRELGRGGMSTVFLGARDDDQFERRVAIKMMRTSAAGDELFERFRIERQVLADLEHPAIARLYESGTSADGLPYIVMEYVADGLRIDDYCDRNGLTVQRRIELFRSICEAVAYAHRRLVVHRDIKPTNILVTADGEPKLLDFGISKLLSPTSPDFTLTMAEVGPMTPAYASPEQLRGQAITTASDVFSLGVLLHKLLTGNLPFGGSMGERVDELTQGFEPRAPTERAVEPDRGPASELFRELDRGRREDLDAIVLKALEMQPEARYLSVADLIEDLDRWASSMPVRARKQTLPYRLSKAVRRNRLPVALAGLALVALAGGAVGVIHQRDIARQRADESNSVVELLVGLFEQADPAQSRGAEVTVREVLDKAVPRIAAELAAQPRLRARLFDTIGRVYFSLGMVEDAESMAQQAAASIAPSSEEHGINLELRGLVAHYQGEHEEALDLFRRAHAEHRARNPRSVEVVRALSGIASALDRLGRFRESEAVAREAVKRLDELGLAHTRDGFQARLLVAEALFKQQRTDEGLPLLIEGLEEARKMLGDDHPMTLEYLMKAAVETLDLARLDEAQRYSEELLETSVRVFAGDHQTTALALDTLGNVLRRQGDLEGAKARFEQALAMFRRLDGERSVGIAVRLANLGWFHLFAADDPASAEPVFRSSLAMEEALFPPQHPILAVPLIGIGVSATRQGRPEEAEPLLRRALSIRFEKFGADDAKTATARGFLAECLTALGKFEESEELLRLVRNFLAETDAGAETVKVFARQTDELYAAWGRPIPRDFDEVLSGRSDE